jgi:hypothetical protein
MPFGSATLSGLSTAVSDIGAGISAEGAATSDLYAAEAEQFKIEGTQFERTSYQQAAALAGQNEQFTAISTRIKAAQAQRELSMSLGTDNGQCCRRRSVREWQRPGYLARECIPRRTHPCGH